MFSREKEKAPRITAGRGTGRASREKGGTGFTLPDEQLPGPGDATSPTNHDKSQIKVGEREKTPGSIKTLHHRKCKKGGKTRAREDCAVWNLRFQRRRVS